MRYTVIGIIGLFAVTGALAAEPKNIFTSSDHGIFIEAPASKDIEAPNMQIAMFFLPASNNFAANVNIQKQKFTDSIEAYDKLTVGQFEQFKLTVLKRTLKGKELRYEYKGDLQGSALHWYARAIKSGAYVYLVTATSLDNRWDEQKLTLIKSVDSFVKQ